MTKLLQILMLGLVFLSTNPTLKSNDEFRPWLKLQQKLDLCGTHEFEKEVLFTLELDTIRKSDSLFGLSFGIKFDPGVVDIIAFGTINTMFELFEAKDIRYDNSDSTIFGYAGNISISKPPISGTKPFVAISAKFKGSCNDTARFRIEYLDFTDEFKKEITSFKNLEVAGTIPDKQDRVFKIKSEKDTLEFDTDDINESRSLNFSLEANYPTKGIISIANVDKNYKITSVKSQNSSIEINDIEQQDETTYTFSYDIKSKLSLSQKAFSLEILESKKDSIIYEIEINNKIIQECSCILASESEKVSIKANKVPSDTLSVVMDDDTNKFNIAMNENQIIVSSDQINISRMALYTLLSEQIAKADELSSNTFTIENSLPKGVYLLVIYGMNHKIYTIKIAK